MYSRIFKDEVRSRRMKNSILIVAGLAVVLGAVGVTPATLSGNQNAVPQHEKDLDPRFKRQSNATTTTTARPRKDRPDNIFGLISVLVSETRNDTSRAINEIGNLFNSQFSDGSSTRMPPKNEHQTATSTAPPESTDADDDSDTNNEAEPFRITRDEFFGILRSNVQGLVQLFRRELRTALMDSNQNARQFAKDFRKSLRPYFT